MCHHFLCQMYLISCQVQTDVNYPIFLIPNKYLLMDIRFLVHNVLYNPERNFGWIMFQNSVMFSSSDFTVVVLYINLKCCKNAFVIMSHYTVNGLVLCYRCTARYYDYETCPTLSRVIAVFTSIDNVSSAIHHYNLNTGGHSIF